MYIKLFKVWKFVLNMKGLISKRDTTQFGDLFKLIGGVMITLIIISYLEEISREIYWINNLLIIGYGYLLFTFGSAIKERDVENLKYAIKHILIVTFILLILSISTFIR